MQINEKLQFIQQVTGFTQAQMAQKLGVTFAALNRWMRKKATPRSRAHANIDKWYLKLTGQKSIPDSLQEAKKALIAHNKKEYKNVLKTILNHQDIYDQFILALTYNSNRIEGSTLSEDETASILFDNVALKNKSLVEQLEAKNHQTALEHIFEHMGSGKKITGALILKLHAILMNGIRSDAGTYRNHGVRIVRSYVPSANHIKIPTLMKKLINGVTPKQTDFIGHASLIHSKFEQIHPFFDGNGRIGRLLLHAMLLQNDLPPAVIDQKQKRKYMNALNKSQIHKQYENLEHVIMDGILNGYSILKL